MTDGSNMPVIRKMTNKDLPSMIEIDIKVLGKARPEYWEMKLALAEKHSPVSSLVAEVDDKVVGFIIGAATGWEYGVPESLGWIDTIGVHPDYQKRGIARMLFQEMLESLKKLGINRVHTYVAWRDWGLLKFFNAMGFQKGDMVNLELKI
jgi:ribosomal protein S18 acetylase RimI-like enzyme